MKRRIWLAIARFLKPFVLHVINNEIRVYGERSRLHLSSSAFMVNTLFNTSSGTIRVGEHVFTGHNVSIITGTHDPNLRMEERQSTIPESGRDINIENGVWIASNAMILGPCNIGEHSVIAAGAVVTGDVPAKSIVAGVPAKVIRRLD